MRVLGLDYGSKTIGVAVSDPLRIAALGLEVIRRPEEAALKKSLSRLRDIVKEYGVATIVLGYPKNLNNTESERCVKTAAFKDRLRANFKSADILLWDERLTSVYAEKTLKSAGLDIPGVKHAIDKTAAVLILQSYLDYQRTCDGSSNGDINERDKRRI